MADPKKKGLYRVKAGESCIDHGGVWRGPGEVVELIGDVSGDHVEKLDGKEAVKAAAGRDESVLG